MSRGLLAELNKRLNEMIRESISKYPYLFKNDTCENKQLILVKLVKEATISEWLRNLIPNRTYTWNV